MRKKTRRQRNEQNKRRFDAVKNLMSTFAMSTVAVVAVVTLIPASPKAEIIKTVALSEEIVYQVNVTDEENALDLDSLTVVLENQLEHYEQSIPLGESAGYFEALTSDTQYRLSVYGNKGFGNERLDTTFVTTRAKVGATILGVEAVPDFHNSIYYVDVSVYDPNTKYTDITLYYGYGWEPGGEFFYSSIPITSDRQMIELFDVFTSYPFHIYIEGTTLNGTELLDEIWVTPPLVLDLYVELAYYNNNEVVFHAEGSMVVDDLVYQANIYHNDRLIKIDTFVPNSDYYSNRKWNIDDLTPETDYIIEFIAQYQNPQTLRMEETILSSKEITTTSDYQFTYTTETVGEYLEVTVLLDDPDDVLHMITYEVHNTSGEFPEWITGESFVLEQIDDTKTYTVSILIPVVDSYEIYIGLYSSSDHYIRQEIVTIHSE